jgi:hypothetical protein
MTPELHDEAYGRMLGKLAEGFDDEDTIIASVVEMLSDDDLDEEAAAELAEQAPDIYRAAAFEHEREKITWPVVTDCDRLDAAFDELNQRGILARHHWWCCQTCGHGAMPEERDRTLSEGRPARGYAFYHVQDTESAAESNGIYLAYGAFADEAEAAVAVAQEVVDVLRAHQLAPTWDGTAATRVRVELDWKRRARPARWTEE